MNGSDAIKIARHYFDWIDSCRMFKSEHTIESYKVAMNSFINYLVKERQTSKGNFCSSKAFSSDNIRGWIKSLISQNIKPQSCNVRLAGIRSFLKYLAEKDMVYSVLRMAAKDIGRIKTEKNHIESLSKKAIKAVLAAPNLKTKTGFRDAVLMAMLYATGCRIDEILSIMLKDLHLDVASPFVHVIGKGGKPRNPYLAKVMVDNLRGYLKRFHDNNADGERLLFYSNVKGLYTKLSQESIRKRLKLYAEQAHQLCEEVPLNLHSHLFRHSMAEHRLEDDINIVQLSKELGHTDPKTTMAYLDIVPRKKEKAIAEIESEEIKKMPKHWKQYNGDLASLFK